MREKLFNPDYLLHLCQQAGLRPSRQYGQNYLINPEVIDQMIAAAGVTKNDTVVEVGPGFGVLTFALAETAGQVVAFEIEKKLQKYWARFCQSDQSEGLAPIKNLQIIWGNVLHANFDWGENTSCSLFSRASAKGCDCGRITRSQEIFSPQTKYKVIANLPYQITSQVLRKFLESNNPPETMTVMVQKEVAERICARPGDMSLLSLAVQYYGEPEIVAVVTRDNFWPEPKVDSAIIKIKYKKSNIKNSDSVIGHVCHSEPCLPTGRQSEESPTTSKTNEDPSHSFGMTSGGEPAIDPTCHSERSPADWRGGVEESVAFTKRFFDIARLGFANRRKFLIKNLSSLAKKSELAKVFDEMGLKNTVRAQELSVEQWKILAEKL